MSARAECQCFTPQYHRARIVYRVGPLRLRSFGRWCARCFELIPDNGRIVGAVVWLVMTVRGEIEARADCIEHEDHELAAVSAEGEG